MSEQSIIVIDDRKSGDLRSNSGNEWHLVTDAVMGGVSKGRLCVDAMAGRPCLRMLGDISLKNNGGFVQAALNLSHDIRENISEYSGLWLEVYGNDERYNIHLRTDDLSLPWQSYRATFKAASEWKKLYYSFNDFVPYRVNKTIDVTLLKRIGIVAIGRVFSVDLCIGKIGLYK
ncbi:CIA30 family protein [Kaarinaea lacus]